MKDHQLYNETLYTYQSTDGSYALFDTKTSKIACELRPRSVSWNITIRNEKMNQTLCSSKVTWNASRKTAKDGTSYWHHWIDIAPANAPKECSITGPHGEMLSLVVDGKDSYYPVKIAASLPASPGLPS